MTGAYLRVKRNGKWENIEIEYLTDKEREELIPIDPAFKGWLNLVCNKLREVTELIGHQNADICICNTPDPEILPVRRCYCKTCMKEIL